MVPSKLKALPCTISQGSVSDECAFEIRLSGGTVYSGVAPKYYFWDNQGRQLDMDEPGAGRDIPGRVAARLLEESKGTALVSIPDGHVVAVDASTIADRPTEEIRFDVSIRP